MVVIVSSFVLLFSVIDRCLVLVEFVDIDDGELSGEAALFLLGVRKSRQSCEVDAIVFLQISIKIIACL